MSALGFILGMAAVCVGMVMLYGTLIGIGWAVGALMAHSAERQRRREWDAYARMIFSPPPTPRRPPSG